MQKKTTRDWENFKQAVILIVDWDLQKVVKRISGPRPPCHIAKDAPCLYTAGSIYNNHFYVANTTEIHKYDLDSWQIVKKYSHETFNDIHHVAVDPTKKQIIVTNTGFEAVQLLNMDGSLFETFGVGCDFANRRFSHIKDFRTLKNTKPHHVHVNHARFYKGEVYATRFFQKDLICLTNFEKRIDIKIGNPHDGFLVGDDVWLTTTNGFIVKANIKTLTVTEVYNVNLMYPKTKIIGWVRGIYVIKGQAYIGMSSFRPTKFAEFQKWIRKGICSVSSRIIQIDLSKKRIVQEWEIASSETAAIHSITPYPL